ncbi:hypothetical protein [Actinophytocola oryzae]|uniref:Uncharacterized protein n=1 Tax=Actinophytocola oryzae TaxID=502181 RepID=A0A4R7VXU9_9PSEU|nr:hypothetical protein [Actinophytocola oryzae]TDV54812.1 hypothetical protein CLV71_10352 [Actinophytocola oryzae]
MTDVTQLKLDDGVRRLAATGVRGFLGVDPVTQNDALLAKVLSAREAHLFGWGDAVLGYAPNLDNPRQAEVATTSPDPSILAAFTEFLRCHRRYTSFVCVGGPPEALRGFRHAGRLRAHHFGGGRYHDVDVHVSTGREAPS